MFGQLTYIYWLVLFIGLPLLLLVAWRPRVLWRQRRALGLVLLGAAVGGWAWDLLAVRLGAWYYDERNIVNIWLGGLPLEEWLWIAGVTLLFGAVTVLLVEHPATSANHRGTEAQRTTTMLCLCASVPLWLALQAFPLTRLSHLAMLLVAAVVFHAMLWARNAAFLWSRRRTILNVMGIAGIWQLITDPIGGAWGAWFFDPQKVVGLWLFTYMPIEDLFGITVVSSAAACAVLVFGYGPRRWI